MLCILDLTLALDGQYNAATIARARTNTPCFVCVLQMHSVFIFYFFIFL